ncbi:MAG: alpha/beta hydrolase family protein [Myxococcaceae bacterium]
MTTRWTLVVLLFGCRSILVPVSAQPNIARAPLEAQSKSGESLILEQPTGPFQVGRAGYHWIDSKRSNRFATESQTHRELMVYVWYPASLRPGDIEGPYLPGARQMEADPALQRRLRGEFGVHWPSIVSGAIKSHAAEGAQPIRKPSRFPVLIFSHGNGSTGFSYTSLIEELASNGYVVAAIEHTQTAVAVHFPSGKVVPFQDQKMPAGLPPAEGLEFMMSSATIAIAEGAADIQFVKERLAQLNASDSRQFPLARRLDMKRVVAMGHSAGGAFATRACQLDSSLAACVNLDGGMPPVAALPVFPDRAVMKQPLLLLEPQATEGSMFGTVEQIRAYLGKKEEQLQSSAQGSYHVILKAPGIAHPSFSDTPIFFAGTDGYPPISAVRHNHRLIQSFARTFLDKNLKSQKASLLDEPSSAHSEAIVQRCGLNSRQDNRRSRVQADR